MPKELIREVTPHQKLYRDTETGIAWIEDGSTGMGYSCHPSIDSSGSVRGMKDRGYWDQEDKTVKSHGFIFNVSRSVIGDDNDRIVADECRCGGQH